MHACIFIIFRSHCPTVGPSVSMTVKISPGHQTEPDMLDSHRSPSYPPPPDASSPTTSPISHLIFHSTHQSLGSWDAGV